MSKIQKRLPCTNLYLYVQKFQAKLSLYTKYLEPMSERNVTYEVHYVHTYKNEQLQLHALWICTYMFSL
jgi:hypothetical protein